MEQGHRVTSIGKLHYQDSVPKRNGFDEEILPMHIVNGVGDLLGLIRDELPVRQGSKKLGPEAGPGESEYTQYDRDIAAQTQRWLTEEAPKYRAKPWVLYVGFVCPALSADRAAAVLQPVSRRKTCRGRSCTTKPSARAIRSPTRCGSASVSTSRSTSRW